MPDPTFTRTHIIIGNARVRVSYVTGPWIDDVDPALIKIRPWTGNYFPAEVRKAFSVENRSDPMTDYVEGDAIRLLPGHPHYAAVNAVAPR